MINSEKVMTNIEKFDIFPSHQPVFDKIIKNLEEERKLIIRGEQLSGKTFFCHKLVRAIVDKYDLTFEKTRIYDLPLIILKRMWECEMREFSINELNCFLGKKKINEVIELENLDIIILDDINDFSFRDLLKIQYPLSEAQILIQVIDNTIYYSLKESLNNLGYKVYQLVKPPLSELKNMIQKYYEIFRIPLQNLSGFGYTDFKSIIN